LSEHLDRCGYFDPRQSAYRKNHSCETALLKVLDTSYTAIDNKEVVVLLLLDLTAAFDSVNHQILGQRLKTCGIDGPVHEWIMGYLYNRSQRVCIDGTLSTSLPLTVGIPQGSVLGPLLFTLYLTGLDHIISPHEINYVLFADDLQLFVNSSVKDISMTVIRLQNCANAVSYWLKSSLLTVNPTKSEFIIFGSRSSLDHVSVSHLSIGPDVIQLSSEVRDLGVLLDPTLSFTNHVSKVRSKSFMCLRMINRLRRCLTSSQYSTLIRSLVLSNVDYCASVIHGMTKAGLRKLQGIANACVRCVHRLSKSTSIGDLSKKMGWLTVKQRIFLRQVMIMHKVVHYNQPDYLYRLIHTRVIGGNQSLRSQSQRLLDVPRARTVCGSRAFRVSGPTFWNSLPLCIREEYSPSKFRNKVIQFLFECD
jgi:hypothetical protein